jgi:hypothetical protein
LKENEGKEERKKRTKGWRLKTGQREREGEKERERERERNISKSKKNKV